MRTGENIYKRKDGRWEARFQDGYKDNGQPHYKSVYGKSYTEAKEKRLQCLTKPASPQAKKTTLNTLFGMFITRNPYRVKESTLSTYYSLYHSQIKQELGNRKLCQLTDRQINEYLSKKLDSHTPKYVNDMKYLLLSLLRYAKSENLYTGELSLLRIKVPHQKITLFDTEEQTHLEEYILNHLNLITIGVLLVFYAGIRIGELCALRMADIDLLQGQIKVTKTLQRIKNLNPNDSRKTLVVIGPPKTDSSIRDIPIPAFLLPLLEEVMKGYHGNAFFLTGSIEKFCEPRTMENKYKRILKDARIVDRKFHAIRHTYATTYYQLTHDARSLMELLGHSNIAMTLNRYVQSSSDVKQKQIEALNSAFLSRQGNRHLTS